MVKKQSFLKGVLILGIAGIVIKILGAFYRIPLIRMIGDTGIGYYQTAYPIYVLLLVAATAGLPTAISKMVSERTALGDHRGAHRIFQVSLITLLGIGIFTCTILLLTARPLVNRLGNPLAYYSMISLAPALFFGSTMAAFRGYFQGLQSMVPTAVSQVVEQLGRTIGGLILAYILLARGLEWAAAGATFAATIGAICGTIIIVLIYLKRRKGILEDVAQSTSETTLGSTKNIIYRLMTIAIPITLGASVMPIMNNIDVAIVMRRLQVAGFSVAESNALYGQLTGMAQTLINLPQVITMALATSLVPAISEAMAKNNLLSVQKNTLSGLRINILLGLPAAVGLIILADPIILMLYNSSEASAGIALQTLAMGVIFLMLIQTLTGILQGIGKPGVPVKNLMIGALCKVVVTYTLTGIAVFNIKGAALGTVMGYVVAATLNYFAVKKYTKIKIKWLDMIVKPLLGVSLMAIVVLLVYHQLITIGGNTVATAIAIVGGGMVYGLVLLYSGSITSQDFDMLPKGKWMVDVLKKAKLLKD